MQSPTPQQPQQEPQRPITAEDIQRQQRASLALRALDLETENVLLQQEVAQLKARIEDLEGVTARHAKSAAAARADA